MERKMNFQPMRSSTPTTSAVQDNGNKNLAPDFQFQPMQYPWCPFPTPPSGWCMSSPYGFPGYYPSPMPPFVPRMQFNAGWSNNLPKTGTIFEAKLSALTPSDSDSSTISPQHKEIVGVKKEGAREEETGAVIFVEEKLNFSNKERITWNDREYCAACFELLESWSACPKLSSFTEKKKNALRHASQKNSTDWKTELRRCFPNSSPVESAESNQKEESHREEEQQTENIPMPDSEKSTKTPLTKLAKNAERVQDEGCEPEKKVLESTKTESIAVPDSEKSKEAPATKFAENNEPVLANCPSHISGDRKNTEFTEHDVDPKVPKGGKRVDVRRRSGLQPYQKRLREILLSRVDRSAPLNCKKCNHKFQNTKHPHNVESHVLTHFPDALFECGICGSKLKRIKYHWLHHSKDVDTNNYFDYRPRYSEELMQIVEQCFGAIQNTDKNTESEAKGRLIKSNPPTTDENRKVRRNGGTKRIPLMFLAQVNKFSKSLKRTKIGKVKCQKCGRDLSAHSASSLESHVYVHSDVKLKTCRLCNFTGAKLSHHFVIKHPNESQGPETVIDHRYQFDSQLVELFKECFPDMDQGQVQESSGTNRKSQESADSPQEIVEMDSDVGIRGLKELLKEAETEEHTAKMKNDYPENLSGPPTKRLKFK